MSCMAMAHHIQLLVMPSARSAHAAAACETRRGKSIVISALHRLAIPYHEDLCLTISSSPPRRRPSLTQSTPSLTGSHRGVITPFAAGLTSSDGWALVRNPLHRAIHSRTDNDVVAGCSPRHAFRWRRSPPRCAGICLARARYLLRRLVWAVAGAG